jgi:hypothetical protein
VHTLNTRVTNAWATLAHHYQARRDLAERAIPAIGLALLLDSLLKARPAVAYPTEWHTFLIVVVACFGFYNTLAGFIAALVLAAWPLWTLSPYLATLAIAVAVLLHLLILKRFNWALLVAAAPALAYNLIFALPPLLAGMLLGPVGGFWVGALAALWLKVAGGLGNLPTDLLSLHVHPILLSQVAERFGNADSLETLKLMVAPFSTSSNKLLLDVLQVLGCGLAGALVGWLRRMNWADDRPWVNLTISLFAGALVMWATIFLLPVWIGLQPINYLFEDWYTVIGIFLCAVMALGLYSLRFLLTKVRKRPLTPVLSSLPIPAPGTSSKAPTMDSRKGGSPPSTKSGDDSGKDVIKLELD